MLKIVKSSLLRWALGAVLAAIVLVWLFFRYAAEEVRTSNLLVLPPERAEFTSVPAVSPDGRRLAFAVDGEGNNQLWVRDSLAARALPGTAGATYPFWSPDSRTVAFFAGGKLKKIDVTGGPAMTLTDAPNGYGGSWSRNNVILFAPNVQDGLFRVPATGGKATIVTTLDHRAGENAHRSPWFLPDGHHFLYTARNDDMAKNSIFIADLDPPVGDRGRRAILSASSNALYAPPGYLLFVREQTLMAQPFDARKAQTTGDPVPIAEEIGYDGLNIVGSFSVSQSSAKNAVLVYNFGETERASANAPMTVVINWTLVLKK